VRIDVGPQSCDAIPKEVLAMFVGQEIQEPWKLDQWREHYHSCPDCRHRSISPEVMKLAKERSARRASSAQPGTP